MSKIAIILLLLGILVPSMLGYVKKSREIQTRNERSVTTYSDEWDN